MTFVWDESKERKNRARHGISFATAASAFQDSAAVSYLDRVVDGEERWHTLGLIGGVIVLLVVHTSEEKNGEEQVRIISARKATPRERLVYDAAY